MTVEANSIGDVSITHAECVVTFSGQQHIEVDGERLSEPAAGSIVATFNNDGYTGRRETDLLQFTPLEREQIQAQYFDVLQSQVIPAMKEKKVLRDDYV